MPRLREAGQPSWPAILDGVIEKAQRNIHTALPGRVRSYDIETQTAEVQLVVQVDGETVAPLLEVPVCWPGGASGFLHVPLTAGDTVLVVFCEEDYAKWWVTGSISAPEILQRHGLHAIAIPGLHRAPVAATAGHVTLAAQSMLHLGSDTATAFVALANLVDARLAAIQAAFDAHIHVTTATVGDTPTPGVIVPPSPPLGPLASVAATKVKAT